MADEHIYTYFQVYPDHIEIKFDDTLKTSSLVNGNFTLTNDTTATPANVSNPFKTIVLTTDYFSISRTLFLYFNFDLQGGNTYAVHIQNLKTILNETLPDDEIEFFVEGTPDTSNPTEPIPIDIEDHSIKNPTFPEGGTSTGSTGGSGTGGSTTSYISVVAVTPDVNESYYLAPNENGGKISIEFSEAPAANFVNSKDFKLQKKELSGFSKWVTVDTIVAAEGDKPVVNVYLPSQDATPVYGYQTEDDMDHVYWEDGYQYRLTISKSVGV